MSNAIEGLKPELVWKYFAEISKIPRGSKNEKQISAYIVDTAKKLGLEVKQDKFMNVAVKKSASPGHENVKMICLQGHLDMVCEKNKDTVHDFEKDPIELVRKDNILMANGTTLGADNGVAVATNLAIMEDKSLEHGPLEFLFTVDEETGLTGASNLKPGFLQSQTMMNLDSEEEGALYVGCSGGRNTIGTWKIAYDNAPGGTAPVKIIVKGLKGGHSGLEIDKGRGNSIKILNRVLIGLDEVGARLSMIEGGNKSNAIPREAEAVAYIPKKNLKKAKKIVERWNATAKAELSSVEPDLMVVLEEVDMKKKGKVVKKAQQHMLYQTISALPHGVMKMSADIPGLVETSTNVAIIRTEKNSIVLTTSQRSSVASEILEILHTHGAIFTLGGAKATHTEGYPGWKPNLASPILKVAKESYKSLYGKEPAIKAIHAGLECGIIGEKYPGMDMVSFGPTLEGVHSPDEKIYIDTVEKFWKFLLGILKNLN
ncbi:MAG: aminoacyl-histidine dipeptidase [Ignavibacteriales bacterium]|nr:aminoacyl-histidine dipeptidase [Ignavibacteriales bacterium]